MNIKIVFKVVLLIIAMIAGFWSGFAGKSQGDPEADAEQENLVPKIINGIYHDNKNGFKIAQPNSSWKFTPKPNSKNLIKLDITHESGKYGLQVRFYKSSLEDLESFSKYYIESFEKDMKNPPMLENSKFVVQNLSGKAVSFDGRKRNGYFLKSYIFPAKNGWFVLQGGCPFSQKNSIEPELDAIAASFKIL
jgi:hypothetical protein